MSDVDPAVSEHAKALVRLRWGNQVVSRAVATIVERQDELTEAQRADLARVAERAVEEAQR